jgi:hypothetical protein
MDKWIHHQKSENYQQNKGPYDYLRRTNTVLCMSLYVDVLSRDPSLTDTIKYDHNVTLPCI